jgi:hypothetical protein
MCAIRLNGLRALVSLILLIFSTSSAHIAAAQLVSEYHGSNRRDGTYVVPSLTTERARHISRATDFDGRIRGNVYAQLLSFHSNTLKRDLLLAATENDVVYALDAKSGKVIWMKEVGRSVPLSALPCGNIDPLGITGTPAIDERRQAVYFDALVDSGPELGPQHLLFALALDDGSVLPGFPVNVAQALSRRSVVFQPRFQNQRSALTILGDRLFVPYGGHYGDCGPYHGWVISLKLDAPHALSAWATRGTGGGIWAPGGIAYDGYSLFVATGNTKYAIHWSDGEAVLRLRLDLERSNSARDFFVPSQWIWLDLLDLDLGGANPVLLDLPKGQGNSPFVLAFGKDGKAYLLNRDDLGGFGGALLVQKVASAPIRTAPAVYASSGGAFVIFQGWPTGCPRQMVGSALGALRIEAQPALKMSLVWCGSINGGGSPIVTTADGHSDPIVWAVGAEGDNCLHAFHAESGEPLFACGGGRNIMHSLRHFATILPAFGRLFVAGDDQVYAYVPQ